MARYRFQFRPVLTFASVIAIALLIALGNWQLQRLEWKRDLIAQVEALGEAEPIPFVEAVRRARNANASWQLIALALGVSRQAVHKKYGRR